MLTQEQINREMTECVFLPESLYQGPKVVSSVSERMDTYYAYGPRAPRMGRLTAFVFEGETAIVCRAMCDQDFERVSWVVCCNCCEILYSCECGTFESDPLGWRLVPSLRTGPRDRRTLYVERIPRYELQTRRLTDGDALCVAMKLTEDVGALVYQWRIAACTDDILVAVGSFARSVTGKSVTLLLHDVAEIVVREFAPYFMRQSASSDWASEMERLWSNYSEMKNSLFAGKFLRVFNHVVARSVFYKLGFTDMASVDLLEQKQLRPTMLKCVSFFDAVGELVVFLLKQGRQYMLTGDINCFFVSGATMTDWYERAKRVKARFEFLNNPAPLEMDVCVYLLELRKAILDGNSIVKTLGKESAERRIAFNMVTELQTLESRYLSMASSLTMRRQPIGIVLYGEPGIGKTHLTDVLIHFWATRNNLPASTDYRFFHSSEEEYLTNFRSYMYAIVLDDVAQHKPERVMGVDTSLSMMIKMFNNMPFSPPQAALDDKGKTPMMCDIGVVTTNVLDMHIPHYYSKSYAVMRRLPIHIEPVVKKEFRRSNGMSIDPEKTDGGLYSDYWDFIVREPKCHMNMVGTYEVTREFSTLSELLAWLGPVCDKHLANQKQMVEGSADFSKVRLCEGCHLPQPVCACVTPRVEQQANVVEEEGLPQAGLFDDYAEPEATPWRDEDVSRMGMPRFVNMRLLRNFFESMNRRHEAQVDPDHVAFYARVHLPLLMELGYSDEFIEEDCLRYCSQQTPERRALVEILRAWASASARCSREFYCRSNLFRRWVRWLMQWSVPRRVAFHVIDNNMNVVDQGFFSVLGEEVGAALGNTRTVVVMLSLLTTVMMARKLFSMFTRRVGVQSDRSVHGKVPESARNDERVNVWNQSEREVTSVDFHPHRATNLEALGKSMQRSCVTFVAVWTERGKVLRNVSRAMVLGDGVLMNAHAIPRVRFELTVYQGAVCELGPHVTMFVDPYQVLVVPDRDVAFVKTKGMPSTFAGKIRNNLVKRSFNGAYNGFYLLRNEDGSLSKLRVANVRKRWFKQTFNGEQIACHVFAGTPERPTESGECGAPLFLETGHGPVMVGFHSIYDHGLNCSMATAVYAEDIDEWGCGEQVEPTEVPVAHAVVQSAVSYYNYHEKGVLMYHGELEMARVRPKSRVEPTEISKQLEDVGCVQGLDFTVQFSPPLMHSWRPQQKALREFLVPASGLNEVLVCRAAEVMLANILECLPQEELQLIHAYPLKVAINGMPGMAYVDGIKRSTSMGYPYLTTKRKYLVPLEEEPWQDGVTFTQEILDKIELMLDKYERGLRCHPVFNSNLKDEVVTLKKYEAEKTRVFFSCPVDFLCVVRMMFLGFTRVVQRNWKVFHCVVGVNVHSKQWEEVFNHLTQHGDETMIAGDFAGFDKKFPVAFMRWAFWIIKQICVRSGNFTETELLVMDCIEADLVNPTVNWFGMLITLCGGEVSGHQLTTIFNCFCCVLYIMYSYGTVYDVTEFFEKVAILSLGDDHVVGVASDRPRFTHTLIKEVLEVAGVGYTMAEKERPSVPYIHISEVTFLKRTFRYHDGVEGIVGPLEKQSIAKMLKMHVVPKACSREEAVAQAMAAASMESFYHGREFFEFVERTLAGLDVSFELREQQKQFPRRTWNQNLMAFRGGQAVEEICRNQNHPIGASNCGSSSLASIEESRMEFQSKVTRAFPEVRFYGRVRLLPEQRHTGGERKLAHPPDNYQLAETVSESLVGLKMTSEGSAPSPERMAPNEGLGNAVTSTEQNVEFVDEKPYGTFDFSGVRDEQVHRPISADLANFLSRPNKIFQYVWDLNGAAGYKTEFNPWHRFFNATPIKNKIENFAYLRCTLRLKFIINASPFYYGSLGAFYEPLSGDSASADRLGTVAGYAPGSQVLVSQRKGVYLDPQTISTAELVLPFLFYEDYLDVTDANQVSNFGKVHLYQFAALRSANGVAAGGVTINCFAWAEDVEFSGTTYRAALQARRDEWAQGPISRPASIVAGVANRLKDVPVVGQVAMATGMVAGAVRDVASFFGFSNPPVITDTDAVKPVAFHTLASTEQREPINKLSLTAKAETSVGEFPGDVDGDMLVISKFAGRQSFLCGMLWETTRIEDDILFSSAVMPTLYESGGTPTCIFHTPIAYAARLFEFWRGDIIFTFRVIKSKYHRGRLQISWDPLSFVANMPATGNPVVQNVIMDLDETCEVEVRVPYTQGPPFLDTATSTFTPARYWTNTGGNPTIQGFIGVESNGSIQVRVLNPLTAPVGTSSVDILVFVRAAENFEFAGPTSLTQSLSLLQLQSNVVVLGDEMESDPKTYTSVFGEKVVSLRQVLHRQSQAWVWVPNRIVVGNSQVLNWTRLQRLPLPFGFASFGTSVINKQLSAGTASAFLAYNHPLVWVPMCFLGYRGSTNYSFNVRGAQTTPSISVIRNSRIYTGVQGNRSALTAASTAVKIIAQMGSISESESGAAGLVLTNQLTQSGVMVNLPFYSMYKFLVSNVTALYNNTGSAWGQTKDNFQFQYQRSSNTTENLDMVDVYAGSGPDFDCIYFVNCPPTYVIGAITAP